MSAAKNYTVPLADELSLKSPVGKDVTKRVKSLSAFDSDDVIAVVMMSFVIVAMT